MSKKLRSEPIYIAPQIKGHLNDHYKPIIFDERNRIELNARDVDDKITIYERQVKDWFLTPAFEILNEKENCGFIVLMTCLSYFEGKQQYVEGQSSNHNSRRFFVPQLIEFILECTQKKI